MEVLRLIKPPPTKSKTQDPKNNLEVQSNSFQICDCDEELHIILEFISEWIQELRVLEADAIAHLDILTTQCIENEKYSTNFEQIVVSHGWTSLHGWLTPFADFDSVLRSLGNYYFSLYSKPSPRLPPIANSEISVEELDIMTFCSDTLLSCLCSSTEFSHRLSLKATLLVAEISGFCRFGSYQYHKGASGLNFLHIAMKNFFGRIVDIVYEHGGDVINFAGDSMFCIFVVDERKNAASTCLHAALCAGKLNEFANSGPMGIQLTSAIAPHFSLAFGDITFVQMGGLDDEWLFVPGSRCFEELFDCLDLAESGQIICSKSCRDLLVTAPTRQGLAIDTKEIKPSGNFYIRIRGDDLRLILPSTICTDTVSDNIKRRFIYSSEINEDGVEAVRKFVPRVVKEIVYAEGSANGQDKSSELRKVTSVFLKLNSYSPTVHSDPSSLRPFVDLLQEVLKESGGSLRQFVIDNKGCVVVAFWGVPFHTYSNDCSRGLFFASTMVLKAAKLGFLCSVGVTTGQVYCGMIGSLVRKDYVCIGDKVNLASDLMSAAEGRVLVDKETLKQITRRERRCFIPAEEMRVTGFKGYMEMKRPYTYASSEAPKLLTDAQLFGNNTVLRGTFVHTLMNAVSRKSPQALASISAAQAPAKPSGRPGVNIGRRRSEDMTYSEFKSTMVVGQIERNHQPRRISDESMASIEGSGPPCRYTVVVGMRGTGKSTAAQVFKLGAHKRGIRCIHVVMRPGDEIVPFGVIRKVFAEIMGQDTHKDNRLKLQFFKALISRMYPNMAQKQANVLASVEYVLGLSFNEKFASEGANLSKSLVSSEDGKMGQVSKHKMEPIANQGIDSEGLSYCGSQNGASKLNTALCAEDIEVHSDFPAEKQPDCSSACAFDSAVEKKGKRADGYHYESDINHHRKSTSRLSGLFSSRRPYDESVMVEIFQFLFTDNVQFKFKRTSFVIEDAHWADEYSWAELNRLRSSRLELSVLVTLRSHPKSIATQGARSSSRKSLTPDMLTRSVFVGPPPDITSEEAMSFKPEGSSVSMITRDKDYMILKDYETGEFQSRYGLKFRPCKPYMDIMTDPVTTILEMTDFSRGEIDILLKKLLGAETVSDALTGKVLQISSGNAFWCKVIFRYIQENGAEEFMACVNEKGSNEAGSFDSLKYLILHSVGRLTEAQQLVLKHAAVIGNDFSEKALASILPEMLRSRLVKSLEALGEQNLVFCSEEEPVVVYSFQNELIRSTVYASIDKDDLVLIHKKTAEFIEAYYSKDLRPFFLHLCYHYKHLPGIGRQMAFKYAVQAADYAISKGEFSRGLACASSARDIALGLAEVAVLLEVVDVGLDDLNARILSMGKIWGELNIGALSASSSFNVSDLSVYKHLAQGYETLQADLRRRCNANSLDDWSDHFSLSFLSSVKRTKPKPRLRNNSTSTTFSDPNDSILTAQAGGISGMRRNSNVRAVPPPRAPTPLEWHPSYTALKSQDKEKKLNAKFCVLS